jgi:molybdopterin-guanine dinucleotide biosynthesis protein B
MLKHVGGQLSPVLVVTGTSGSGKTTLLEFLIASLAAEGVRINMIKHSHHDLELEPPRKDSARLRMAGAAEVMVASPYRVSIVQELRGAPEPTLEQQLARMSPADLTLLEGFKSDPIPKLEVYRPRWASHRCIHMIRIFTLLLLIKQRRPRLPPHLVWLDLNQRATVLDWVRNYYKESK